MQTTLVIFKPDCILRGLVGEILSRFEKKGLKIMGIKKMQLSNEILKEHYAHLADKPFFPGIVEAMQRTPVILVALRGVDAAVVARKMAGVTNAREAEPGTIRGDLGMSIQNNLVHISDSPESAEIEVKRFFTTEELIDLKKEELKVIYSKDEVAELKSGNIEELEKENEELKEKMKKIEGDNENYKKALKSWKEEGGKGEKR